jgi:hypothetical protein
VASCGPPAGHHLISFGYLLLYGGPEVGEGRAELSDELFNVLGAALQRAAVGLVGDVVGEDLVHQLQISLITDLFDVTPEDGLVLFCGHSAPFSYIPSRLRLPNGNYDANRRRLAHLHRLFPRVKSTPNSREHPFHEVG